MAATDRPFKVYERDGGRYVYVAAVADATLAAHVLAVLNDGRVKVDGRLVWKGEVDEYDHADPRDSTDAVADVILDRVRANNAARRLSRRQ